MGPMAGMVGAVLLGIIAAGLLYQWTGSVRDRRRFPPPGRLVDLRGGRRLHLLESGDGTPAVILEAGIAASSVSWRRVAPAIAGFARVASYDRAGFAWSPRTRGPVSARSLAGDLRTLVEAARVEPPYVIVAHSFGTFVARAFADRFPNDVAGLVLVDPVVPAEWLEMTPAARRRLRGGVFLSRVGAVLAAMGVVRLCLDLLGRGSTGVPRRVSRLFGSEAATVLARLVRQVQKLPPEVWPVMRAHWSRPKSFLAMADHLSSLRRSAAEIAATASLGDLPVVVITAGSHPAGVRADHARLAALSNRGRHVLANEAGHWILLDDPAVVIEAVREVVDQVRRSRGGAR